MLQYKKTMSENQNHEINENLDNNLLISFDNDDFSNFTWDQYNKNIWSNFNSNNEPIGNTSNNYSDLFNIELERFLFYKFKNLETCEKFCNSKK